MILMGERYCQYCDRVIADGEGIYINAHRFNLCLSCVDTYIALLEDKYDAEKKAAMIDFVKTLREMKRKQLEVHDDGAETQREV